MGTAVGLVMGYYRGIVDDVLGRVVEAFLALPLIVTGVLAISALGRSNAALIIVIGIVFTPLIARTVRAAVLQERELDYVAAARLRGESGLYIMFAEILPNVLQPIIVEATVRLGYAIFFANNLLMPLWLQTQIGYTATWAGLVAAPTGAIAVLLTPLSARALSAAAPGQYGRCPGG